MGITFSAGEVFEMAEEIERNGAKFYRIAAERVSNESEKAMLLDMAEMEDGHLRTFESMRKELSEVEEEVTIFDPDNEAALYLQAMADAKGCEGKISVGQELTGNESIREILEIAVRSEKESVLFYVGLKDLVPAKAGRDKIEKIITEEVRHITTLLEQLRALRPA
jgi:rubrerythrin